MGVLVYAFIVLILLGSAATILEVGKERKPVTHFTALFTAIFGVVHAVILIQLGQMAGVL